MPTRTVPISNYIFMSPPFHSNYSVTSKQGEPDLLVLTQEIGL